jgi:chaperonin GroEL
MARLTNGIGVIRVAGETEMETANLREIVDDAVRAVYSAMDGGIVPGGGRMLEDCLDILGSVATMPKKVIWGNAGLEAPYEFNRGWRGRLIGGEEVDLLEEGIVDPAKVVISSLRAAVSAAIQFMTTKYFLIYR